VENQSSAGSDFIHIIWKIHLTYRTTTVNAIRIVIQRNTARQDGMYERDGSVDRRWIAAGLVSAISIRAALLVSGLTLSPSVGVIGWGLEQ
jgi:hypothetical protein